MLNFTTKNGVKCLQVKCDCCGRSVTFNFLSRHKIDKMDAIEHIVEKGGYEVECMKFNGVSPYWYVECSDCVETKDKKKEIDYEFGFKFGNNETNLSSSVNKLINKIDAVKVNL